MSRQLGWGLMVWLVVGVAIGGADAAPTRGARPRAGAPALERAPSISGTAAVGSTLHVFAGRWVRASRFVYRWERCNHRGLSCQVIHRPAASHAGSRAAGAYTVTRADLGKTIRVTVLAGNARATVSAVSRPTAVVSEPATKSRAPRPALPVNTVAPSIGGRPQPGATLTAGIGRWSHSPDSYALQWQRCSPACADISGATASLYTVSSADLGKTIDVMVRATNAAGTASARSAHTALVALAPPAAPVNTSAPAITGTPEQGRVLTATTGSWSQNPTSFAYRWRDCSSGCADIPGATSAGYTPTAADVGDTIDVVVSAANAGGTGSATSSPTVAVAAAPPVAPQNISAPAITGTPQQGQVLTTTTGSWSNNPAAYAYQWQDCVASLCSAIAGATASHYTLAGADVGKTVDVVVSASNAGGSASAPSAPTSMVAALGGSGLSAVHVAGNQLIDGNGQSVVLHGVARNGTDYACQQAFGFTDGPTGDAEFSPMVGWKINSVVLGINEDCWLGINGVPAQWAGQNYIDFIKSEVASAEKYGVRPVLAWFVGEPGTDTPNWYDSSNGNPPLPDNDHAPLVWEELASTFKGDPNVIFRAEEEPHPANTGTGLAAWQCWSQGDVQYAPSSVRTPPMSPVSVSANRHCHESDSQGTAYQTIGMQAIVNIIRGAGASNVIQIPGVAFANMMACSNTGSPTQCGFLDSTDGVRVTDPLSSTSPQLMADVDVYPDIGQICSTVSCYNATFAPVAAVMPFDAGELGVMNNANPFPQAQAFATWADAQHAGYYASAWDTWSDLISNYTGSPAAGWGTYYYNHITSLG